MNLEIAGRLVDLRKENNLSQEALAEKLGISRQAVSKWERAEASPDTDNLIALARLYHISLDELLMIHEDAEEGYAKTGAIDDADEFINEEESYGDRAAGHLFTRGKDEELPLGIIAIFVYIIIGACFNLWHPGWLIFFLVPIISSLLHAVRCRNINLFAYPALVVFVFLYVGLVHFIWHPTWVVFLTIPVYYSLTGYITRNFMKDVEEE